MNIYEGILTRHFDGVRDYWVLKKEGGEKVNLTIELFDFEGEKIRIIIQEIEENVSNISDHGSITYHAGKDIHEKK